MEAVEFLNRNQELYLSALQSYAGYIHRLLDLDGAGQFNLLYSSKKNWFSNSHVYATEVNGEPAALALGLDFNTMNEERKITKKLFRKVWSKKGVEVFNILDLLVKNLDKDSFWLLGLAVRPEVNFARELQEIIRFVSLEAMNRGCSNLSIFVSKEDKEAKMILQNFGFSDNKDIELGTNDKVLTVTKLKKTGLML